MKYETRCYKNMYTENYITLGGKGISLERHWFQELLWALLTFLWIFLMSHFSSISAVALNWIICFHLLLFEYVNILFQHFPKIDYFLGSGNLIFLTCHSDKPQWMLVQRILYRLENHAWKVKLTANTPEWVTVHYWRNLEPNKGCSSFPHVSDQTLLQWYWHYL